MDASTWMTAVDVLGMLSSVREWTSARKYRLFALACCRRREDLLRGNGPFVHACQKALGLGERLAEEKVSQKELVGARSELEWARREYGRRAGSPSPAGFDEDVVAEALDLLLDDEPTGYQTARRVALHLGRGRSSIRAQLALLREVMGNPFRPVVIDPQWLAWDSGLVRNVAQVAYEGRAFDRLPILADALEDAGCSDATILDHLRGGGPHVLGCWALDALLGKA